MEVESDLFDCWFDKNVNLKGNRVDIFILVRSYNSQVFYINMFMFDILLMVYIWNLWLWFWIKDSLKNWQFFCKDDSEANNVIIRLVLSTR